MYSDTCLAQDPTQRRGRRTQVTTDKDLPIDRESIWSVERDDLAWYSVLFPVLWLAGVCFYVILVVEWGDGVVPVVAGLILLVGSIGISAASCR